jgi:hypothetical protein
MGSGTGAIIGASAKERCSGMKKALFYVFSAVVVVFAVYGAVKLVSGFLTEERGKRAAQTVNPFVKGVASVAAEDLKQSLSKTPDDQLERDAELYTKKFYPIAKGIFKGLAESVKNDPERAEIQQKAYQAGKDVSEHIVRPFSRGLFEGSEPAIGDLEKRVGEVRNFTEKNKDVLDALSSGLNFLQNTLKNMPAPPPPPGMRPRMQQPEYQQPYSPEPNSPN